MKLNINITVELTEQEMLDILTDALYNNMRYKDGITSTQVALRLGTRGLESDSPCYLVIWGEKPEEPIPGSVEAANQRIAKEDNEATAR